MTRSRPSLWKCPKCGESFTTRNQWHSCGRFDLEPLFAECEPSVRQVFDRLLALVREIGPVEVIPQKSRIALQVRMRFAALMPQKRTLKGHLVLARRHDLPRFEKVETYSPQNHVHVFRLATEDELDAEFNAFLQEAYDVGCQKHLGTA